MKSPSEKQIKLAEKIAYMLDLDFPICSKQYNAQSYYQFINENIEKLKEIDNHIYDENDCMFLCQNDSWCEYY